jgi:hypothetical protein
MVAAHIKKTPLKGPTAKNVATPARPPMLKESAVSWSKEHFFSLSIIYLQKSSPHNAYLAGFHIEAVL